MSLHWTDNSFSEKKKYIDSEVYVSVKFSFCEKAFFIFFDQITFNMITESGMAVPLKKFPEEFGWHLFHHSLFRPQTLHRICQRSSDRLIAHRQQCNGQCANASCDKNPPGNICSIFILLQPIIHEIITDGNSHSA